jgi:hypothetical protein
MERLFAVGLELDEPWRHFIGKPYFVITKIKRNVIFRGFTGSHTK